MPNRIILKRSSVATKAPAAADLSAGELAINLADRRLFSKDTGGSVISVTVDATHITSGTVSSARLSGSYGIDISGNAATVTNGVYTTGNQSVSGVKTFVDAAYFNNGYTEFRTAIVGDGIYLKNASSQTVLGLFVANSRANLSCGSGSVNGFNFSTSATSGAWLIGNDGAASISTTASGNSLSVSNSLSGYSGVLLQLSQTTSNSGNYYNYTFIRCSDNYQGQVFYVNSTGYTYAQQFYSPNATAGILYTLGTYLQTSVMWYWNGSYYVYDQSNRFYISSGSSQIYIGTTSGVGSTTYFYNTKYFYNTTYFWDYQYFYGYNYFYGSYTYFGSNGFTCDGTANLYNAQYSQYYYGNWSGTVYLNFGGQRQVWFNGLGGDVTFGNTSNKTTGRRLEVILQPGGTARNLYFPGWTWVGTAPTSIAANKTAVLTLWCVGANEADVIAQYFV